MPYTKYLVITRREFFGESKHLWNISDKSKREYIPLFEYGFTKGQIITKRSFTVYEGKAYHKNAIKKQLHTRNITVNKVCGKK